MKIAVLNTNGAQETTDGKLKFYFEVLSNYDFSANQATDVTTIENLVLFLNYNRIDLIKLRTSLKDNILSGWANLTDVQKKYLVSIFIYPTTFTQADIDLLFTAQEQLSNWKSLADLTEKCRSIRWNEARKEISFIMSESDILMLYLATKPYKDDFIDANLPHLILWITNGVYAPLGINFILTGFAQKTYYSVERKDLLVDILVNGNY